MDQGQPEAQSPGFLDGHCNKEQQTNVYFTVTIRTTCGATERWKSSIYGVSSQMYDLSFTKLSYDRKDLG